MVRIQYEGNWRSIPSSQGFFLHLCQLLLMLTRFDMLHTNYSEIKQKQLSTAVAHRLTILKPNKEVIQRGIFKLGLGRISGRIISMLFNIKD